MVEGAPMKYTLKEGFVPDADEQICVVSYVIAYTRVGGGPEQRPGFWPAYREAQEVNRRTHFQNHRVGICRGLIEELFRRYPSMKDEPVYFRNGGLAQARIVDTLKGLLGSTAFN